MWEICRMHRADTGGPRNGHLCSSRYSRKKSPPKQQGFSLANVVPCRLFCGAPFLTDRTSLELVKSPSLQGRVQSHGPGSNDASCLRVGAKQPSWRWGFARVVSASQASFLTLRHSGPVGVAKGVLCHKSTRVGCLAMLGEIRMPPAWTRAPRAIRMPRRMGVNRVTARAAFRY